MSTRNSDAIRPYKGDIRLPLKQQIALEAWRRRQKLADVMAAVGCKKSAACRLVKRARHNLKPIAAIAAVGGDPLDALADVRKIFAI
jgi:hypothetical protein